MTNSISQGHHHKYIDHIVNQEFSVLFTYLAITNIYNIDTRPKK